MCIVLDASGSVRDDWSTLLSFVIDVVKVVDVGPDGTHIGVVIFGDNAELIFDFNEFKKTSEYEMKISLLITSIQRPSSSERTFINRGFLLANRRVLREEFGMRPDAKQVRTFCNSVFLCLPLCLPTPSVLVSPYHSLRSRIKGTQSAGVHAH